ncbi:ABC transporter ATP-binding protein [Bengtsoniella intestinalis]|uniref:ATP-binding cassette domain-containing protein n=1 Tax=Bengtsoniella intestinalis TaxID=3073143 RepID=UPI00391FB9B0
MITISNLSKQYFGGNQALTDMNLTLPRGEIVGIFGENGAGKTTLMKCVFNFMKYDGTITLDGEPITHKNIETLSFATCEHSFFSHLSPADHRDFYARNFPKFRGKRFDALMTFFELPTDRHIGKFSVGQQNQFEVICALSQGADYIFMDEPFAGNDVFNREDFYKVLLGILEPTETVILSTHLLEEVEHFISRAVLIRKGTILQDVQMSDLEDNGKTLMQFVKESYAYQSDRVSRALDALTEDTQ